MSASLMSVKRLDWMGPDSWDLTANATLADPVDACSPLATGSAEGKIVVFRADGLFGCSSEVSGRHIHAAGAVAGIYLTSRWDYVKHFRALRPPPTQRLVVPLQCVA